MSPQPALITPSVGRKVWYYANSNQADPWDATVVKVHDPENATPHSAVNLLVFNPDTGESIFRPCIAFYDESAQWPNEHYRWMPYQTKVAATQAVLDTPVPSGVTSGGIEPAAIETKTYADGSMAAGPGPLPDESPDGAPVSFTSTPVALASTPAQAETADAEPGQLP